MLGGPLEESNPMTAKVSALTYIGPKEPPFFIRHGSADENIPFLQSFDLAEDLKAKGNKVDFSLVPGGPARNTGHELLQDIRCRGDVQLAWKADVGWWGTPIRLSAPVCGGWCKTSFGSV